MQRKTIIIINAIIVLACLCIYFYFNPIIKNEPKIGATYFNIPLIISKKNVDEIIKISDTYSLVYGGPNETILNSSDNGWVLDIIFNNTTREIRIINLYQNIDYYKCLEFNNANIDTFLKVGNLDKKSESYDLWVQEKSNLSPFKIGRPIEDKFNNIISLAIYPKKINVVFDIPNLIGKDITTISKLLGSDFVITTDTETNGETLAEWIGILKKEGYTLYITIDSKSKKTTLFQIVLDKRIFENPKDMLTIGNLDSVSKAYTFVLGRTSNPSNKFNSVTIYPKNN